MKFRDYTLIAAVAFSLGLGASYLIFTETPEQRLEAAQAKERITLPEGGIDAMQTAAFPVQVLQAAMRVTPKGNVLVTPNVLAALLHRLAGLGSAEAKEAIAALSLPEELALSSVDVQELALLFPDSGTPLAEGRDIDQDIHPVPFSKRLADAMIGIDKKISLYSTARLAGLSSSDALSPDTQLLAFCGLIFEETWLTPTSAADTTEADFYNASGSIHRVLMMRHRGYYRVAEAPDGSWKAVALFFRNFRTTEDTACMVAILPKNENARQFVQEEFSTAQLSAIRKALATATPIPCTIELPKISHPAQMQDIHPLLSELGLNRLFMDAAPLPGLTPATPFHLTLALQQNRFILQENDADNPPKEHNAEDADMDRAFPLELRFDRPFVWYIGELTSSSAPYLMGIIEEM